MSYKLKTKYSAYDVELVERFYANGRLAIELIDANDGCPVMVATVNLPEVPLSEGEIIIKDYSENEGVLDFLQSEGIVGPVLRTAQSGFVQCQIVQYFGKRS